jgi:hypothetical protein
LEVGIDVVGGGGSLAQAGMYINGSIDDMTSVIGSAFPIL